MLSWGKVQSMILACLYSVLGARFFLPLVVFFRRSDIAAIASIPHVDRPAYGCVAYTRQDASLGLGLSAVCGSTPVFCRLVC